MDKEFLIDPSPASEAVFHGMPKLDGRLSETPAKINFPFFVKRWKINEPGVGVLDQYTGFLNFLKFPFQPRETLLLTALDTFDVSVVHLRAAHHHDIPREILEVAVRLLVFFAETKKLPQRLFYAGKSAFGLGVSKESRHSG